MRADVSLRLVSVTRLAVVLLIALGVTACKTEKDADQPVVLGVPAPTAYLGVEYYYNFGAYGGETILDYSLTNAPPWLALEGTSNKARQGIIMRGVPGLTGGNRGAADLGKIQGINLVTTDGQMAGVQPFDIEVLYNPLSLEVDKVKEGETAVIPETKREHCALPDMEGTGEHTFTINEYDSTGDVTGTKSITAETRPIAVRILLDQPSVTKVQVAFELSSEYDPQKCNPAGGSGPVPQQQCDFSDANVGHAIIGQDIVALGSGTKSDNLLEELDYLQYQPDANNTYTSGVVTFEPGITECYIRLEVIDDNFPEPSEVARLTLTEVRNGLAGLGKNNGGVRTNIVIDDDEPVITLKTKAGGTRDTLNVGDSREYVAVLTGDRDIPYKAKLSHTEDSSARLNFEFVIEQEENSVWVESDELVFPVGTNEIPFRIRVKDSVGGYSNPALNDRVILLGLNEKYQRGREGYARAASENMLRVSLNELTSPLVLNPGNGFTPTDFTIAHSGQVFVTGYDAASNDQVLVRIYDQKGGLRQEIKVSDASDQLVSPRPVISAATRKVDSGSTKIDRFEFAVAYSTDGIAAATGTTEFGGTDAIVARYWFDAATNGGEYVRDWVIRTGTDEDDDVRSIAMNKDTGHVLVAGETRGTWPEQTRAGATDSFLQMIGTVKEQDSNGADVDVLKLLWTRQVGSPGDDSVAAVSAAFVTPVVFGSTANSMNGESVLGGKDAYFYSTSSNDGNLSVNQVGTDRDEEVSDGVFTDGLAWLLGNGTSEYLVVGKNKEDKSLKGTGLNSQAGFLLGYTTTGEIKRAFTLNDSGDTATETFGAVSGFDHDLIVAGSTNGDFSGDVSVTPNGTQAVAARISLVPENDDDDEGEPPFKNEWRYQLSVDDSEILVLGNYRDDEITALTRVGTQWLLLLFSPEGELLTP
ncbi:MAG TPA: hypothetical protein VL091_04480 [Marinobacter sp.]|nr:hypothetical protein [Marinobacter sp.]